MQIESSSPGCTCPWAPVPIYNNGLSSSLQSAHTPCQEARSLSPLWYWSPSQPLVRAVILGSLQLQELCLLCPNQGINMKLCLPGRGCTSPGVSLKKSQRSCLMLAGCPWPHTYSRGMVSGSKVTLLIPLEPGHVHIPQIVLAILGLLRPCAEHCSIGFDKPVLDVSCCHGMTHLKNTLFWFVF